MQLTQSDIEAMAENRLLMAAFGDILEACKERDPQFADQLEDAIDEVVEEYVHAVNRNCPRDGDVERIIRCMEEVRDEEGFGQEASERLSRL